MRLASAISGFACAMQRHAAARPYVPSAILDSVSPGRTVTFRSDFKPVILAGTTISVPATMRVGSTMPGLAARNSCQREPRPRFCCASFQRESPGCTMTVCSEEEDFATAAGGAIAGAAFGCAGGAIAVAKFDFAVDAAIAGAAFGCGAAGVIRSTEGGAAGAKRRVKGSRRRNGAGLAIAGATAASGRAGARFGCVGEKLGGGGASLGSEIEGLAKTGSSNGRWNWRDCCAT